MEEVTVADMWRISAYLMREKYLDVIPVAKKEDGNMIFKVKSTEDMGRFYKLLSDNYSIEVEVLNRKFSLVPSGLRSILCIAL